jgi:hypothetical protein
MTRPTPSSFVGVASGQLLDRLPTFFNYKYLLTAIAAKGFRQRNRY